MQISWELVIGVVSVLGTVIAAWNNLGNRMTKLETLIEAKNRTEEVRDLRIASLESRIDILQQQVIVLTERYKYARFVDTD